MAISNEEIQHAILSGRADELSDVFATAVSLEAEKTGTAAPTTGTWAVGDFVRNTTPAEAGTAGSKYVIFGFVCVTAGSPGSWLPLRALTGN